mgnify:CR=1 FL=1
MPQHRFFPLATPLALSLAVATLLAGCGGSDSGSVAVDTNADSCSVLSSSGSAVVVGSGVAGDPRFFRGARRDSQDHASRKL